MIIMKTLDAYVVKKVATTICFTLLSLVSLSMIIRFTEELNLVGKGNYSLLDAGIFTLSYSISDIETFFPMAGLLGAMIALGQLASSSELVIMQAVGVSKLRILLGLLWVVIPFSALNLAIQQWISPNFIDFAQNYRTAQINQGNLYFKNSSLWEKSADEFVYVTTKNQTELNKVLAIGFDEQEGKISHLIIGNNAVWDNTNQNWNIKQVTVYSFNSNGQESIKLEKPDKYTALLNFLNQYLTSIDSNAETTIDSNVLDNLRSQLTSYQENFEVQVYANYQWNTSLNPDKLKLVSKEINSYSISQLWNYIHVLKDSQQNSNDYEYLFWSKMFSAWSFFVMIGVATMSIFGSIRNSSMLWKVFKAIVIGLIFYIINRTLGPFLINIGVPAIAAALIPSLIMLAYWILLYKLAI